MRYKANFRDPRRPPEISPAAVAKLNAQEHGWATGWTNNQGETK